tara:strand:- start:2063 stop:2383 length:321 start_codon:yes stop_codon:yes gene_type:complete
MTWFDIIKSGDPTNILLQIITEDLEVTIPTHIENMSFMTKKLGMPVDYRGIREAFNKIWSNPKQVISMDVGWTRQFIGDGFSMNDVNWREVTIRVMKLYDQIFDNI